MRVSLNFREDIIYVYVCICLLVTQVILAKTAEEIEIAFRGRTDLRWSKEPRVIWGGEGDGQIDDAAAMRAVATITVASCYAPPCG